jgi:parallel beta-helix repeat protein
MLREIIIYGFSFGFVAILVYYLMRYGPVNKTWMRITKEQINTLKQAQNEYYMLNPGLKKLKPKGSPHYKSKLVSHEGVAIYQDGIYGKYCLGPNGKYKFKRFDMISAIFPVEVENPMVKTDSVLMGLKSWKELQVETMDFEVLLIDSRKHNFDVIIPALKRGLVGRWDELYRENQVIRGKILEGEVGWHSRIRTIPPPPPPPDQKGMIFEEVRSRPKDKSRGSLIFEEPPEVADLKAKGMNRLGAILAVLGILSLVFLFLMLFQISVPGTCLFTTSIMLIMFSFLFLVLAVLLFRIAKRRYSIKVYENGVTNFIVGTGEEIFIPFGHFHNISEGQNYFDGAYYKLEAKDQRYSVALNKKTPSIENYMNFIRQQIGRPDLDYPLEITTLSPMLRKFEYIAYAALIIVSVILGYFFSYSVFGDSGDLLVIFGMGILFPIISVIAVFLIAYKFVSFYKNNNDKKGIDIKTIGAIFLIMLAIFYFSFYYGFFLWEGEDPIIEIVQDPMPQSGVPLTLLASDSQIILNDNLVLDDETLILHNSTLMFNCSSDKEFSIWVDEDSRLDLINCTLLALNANYGYGFEVYGTANIVNSTVSNVWGDEENENWDGGIEIYSDSVKIMDSTITQGQTNGILVFDCSPLISGNTIRGCPDDGLEVHFSELTIVGNTIEHNGWGIIIWPESDVVISHNTIRNNNYGLYIQSTGAFVQDNSFTDNLEYAMKYTEGSDVRMANNEFFNNGADIVEPDPFGDSLSIMCGVGMIVMSVVFFVILYVLQKTNFQGEQGEGNQDQII